MGSPQTLSINFQASNEFIQNAETLSGEQPLLPRSLEVPEMERQMEPGSGKGTGSEMGTGAGTKRNSISDPERNELDMEVDEDVDASGAGTELVPNVSVTWGSRAPSI